MEIVHAEHSERWGESAAGSEELAQMAPWSKEMSSAGAEETTGNHPPTKSHTPGYRLTLSGSMKGFLSCCLLSSRLSLQWFCESTALDTDDSLEKQKVYKFRGDLAVRQRDYQVIQFSHSALISNARSAFSVMRVELVESYRKRSGSSQLILRFIIQLVPGDCYATLLSPARLCMFL